MKIKRIMKLDEGGLGHHFVVPALVVALVAAIGVRVLTASHAATSNPIAYLYGNSSTGTSGIRTVTPQNVITNVVGPTTSTIFSPLSYSPDNNSLAWFSSVSGSNPTLSGQLNIKNLSTNAITTHTSKAYFGATSYGSMQWFPNSSKIAFTSQISASPGQVTFPIYTVNSDGTSLTQVANANSTSIIYDLAVSGDGKYIVYSSADGNVYAVKPGSTPFKLYAGQCDSVVSRPGTAEGFSFECSSSNSTANSLTYKIVYQNIGSSSVSLYSTTAKYGVNGTIKAIVGGQAWSHDGSQLAFQLQKNFLHLQYEHLSDITYDCQ